MMPTLRKTLQRHGLIPPGCHVLLGVSGGADSVALLYALHSLRPAQNFALTAAHLHHDLRGAEADADAEFVQALAWRLGVPCVVERVAVAEQARRDGVSVEMAGRTARYDFFAKVAAAVGADRVATAHHADDQVETLLMRLLRGSSLQGLGGMAYESQLAGLPIIRPLLDLQHADAVAFLKAHRLAWREDATNADPSLLRNRVRLELLPFLESRFQPSVRQALRRTASVVREDQAWLDQLVRPWMTTTRRADGGLARRPWQRLPRAARRRILLSWLRDRGVPVERLDYDLVERVEQWTEASRAAPLTLPGQLRLTRTATAFELRPVSAPEAAPFSFEVPMPGQVERSDLGLVVQTRLAKGFERARPVRPGPGRFSACLSEAKRAGETLLVRSRRPGDRMKPFGVPGTVKLQDVLVDLKVPRAQRDRLPVVTCRGEIVWVPGYRIARDWAVPSAQARSVCIELAWTG